MESVYKNHTTFYDIFTHYYEEKELYIKDIIRYKQMYYNHLHTPLGNLEPHMIKKSDIVAIQKAKKNKNFSPKTINNITDFCSAIFNHGINEELISCNNPLKRVKKLKVDNKRERWLSVGEINALIEEVRYDIDLHIFVLIALRTGARFRTVMKIKRKDINYQNTTVTLEDSKNSSSYIGYLDMQTIKALKSVKKYNPNSNIISYCETTIKRRLKKIFDKLFNVGLDSNDRKNRVVIHTLRHTFFSHLVSNGVPIYTVKKLGNHHDIASTMRYAKLSPDSGANEVRKLYC